MVRTSETATDRPDIIMAIDRHHSVLVGHSLPRILLSGTCQQDSLIQLKVIQECISLTVFVAIANILFQHQSLQWNHVLAFLFIIAAVYLVFMK